MKKRVIYAVGKSLETAKTGFGLMNASTMPERIDLKPDIIVDALKKCSTINYFSTKEEAHQHVLKRRKCHSVFDVPVNSAAFYAIEVLPINNHSALEVTKILWAVIPDYRRFDLNIDLHDEKKPSNSFFHFLSWVIIYLFARKRILQGTLKCCRRES